MTALLGTPPVSVGRMLASTGARFVRIAQVVASYSPSDWRDRDSRPAPGPRPGQGRRSRDGCLPARSGVPRRRNGWVRFGFFVSL